ncbi:Trans-cinnamate:CoA ligase, peroxisomal [Linum perenne]
MDQLLKCDANFVALTPTTFLKRAAQVYSNRTSIIYEGTRFTWLQTYTRCCRLASSLLSLNISHNDVVSVLAPNVPAMYEMHFAVPMAGAVLNPINTRLDANTIATILSHSTAKLFFVDCEFVPLAKKALTLLMNNSSSSSGVSLPLVVVIDDIDSPTGVRLGELEYEQLVQNGNPLFVPEEIQDEWDPITLNYTSGTTSAPKGVVYSHRGAYLSTLSLILGWEMGCEPVYLWSLPMFHCNGWTFTWGIAARGGTNVCIPSLLEKIEPMGFHVTHAYGLTEATGPGLVCEWQAQWNSLPSVERGKLKARQGISILGLADVDVKDLTTMRSVPRDGKVMGEIVLRGSSIMKGYFKDEKATAEAFKDGKWFATGDVGVVHPDGYVEIKDRSKDVIISGGENISSVEVESVLYRYPKVVEAAVVAMPHPVWGESPCAFVAAKTAAAEEAEILNFCRKNMAHFMVPKKVVFMSELPKTATGKIQKGLLREAAKKVVDAALEEEKKRKINKNAAVGRKKVVNGGGGGGGGQGGVNVNGSMPGYGSRPHEHILALSRL